MTIEAAFNGPFALAVDKAGGQSALGRIIGRRQSTVRDRLVSGRPIWAEHVLTIEAELGISRHALRPDIYPVDHGDTPVAAETDSANGIPVECRIGDVTAPHFGTAQALTA